MGGKRFFGKGIKFAGTRVPLDRGVELRRIESLEPRTKPRQLARGELFDGFLDVFGGGHLGDIASTRNAGQCGGRHVR